MSNLLMVLSGLLPMIVFNLFGLQVAVSFTVGFFYGMGVVFFLATR